MGLTVTGVFLWVTYLFFLFKKTEHDFAVRKELSNSIQNLTNVKKEFQSSYILSFGNYGEPAIPILVKLILANNPAIQEASVVALQLMGGVAIENLMKEATNTQRSTIYRIPYVTALGQLGGSSNLHRVLLSIAQDRSEHFLIRVTAIRQLQHYANVDLLLPLLKMIEEPTTPNVIYRAVMDVMDKISVSLSMVESLDVDSDLEGKLASILKNENPDLRFLGMRFLADLKIKGYEKDIKRIATEDPIEYVRQEAKDCLERLKQL